MNYDISKELQPKAVELQSMIVDHIKKSGLKARIKKDAHKYDELMVDGVRVPLRISEDRRSGPWSDFRFLGRLRVSVDWLWLDYTIHMKRKSFPSAKKRAATHGIDLDKVTEHIRTWVTQYKMLREKKRLKQAAVKDWKATLEVVQNDYKNFTGASVKVTERGFEFKATFDERTLRDVLDAMGAKK